MIDDKIQQLTSVIFRVVGSAVLRSGLGGGGGGGASANSSDSDSGRRVSIVLPTYPPEEYDDEDEEVEDKSETTPATDAGENNVIPEEESSAAKDSKKKRSLVDEGKGAGYSYVFQYISYKTRRRKRRRAEALPRSLPRTAADRTAVWTDHASRMNISLTILALRPRTEKTIFQHGSETCRKLTLTRKRHRISSAQETDLKIRIARPFLYLSFYFIIPLMSM